MNRTRNHVFIRLTAMLVCASLALLAPGLPAYAAAGQVAASRSAGVPAVPAGLSGLGGLRPGSAYAPTMPGGLALPIQGPGLSAAAAPGIAVRQAAVTLPSAAAPLGAPSAPLPQAGLPAAPASASPVLPQAAPKPTAPIAATPAVPDIPVAKDAAKPGMGSKVSVPETVEASYESLRSYYDGAGAYAGHAVTADAPRPFNRLHEPGSLTPAMARPETSATTPPSTPGLPSKPTKPGLTRWLTLAGLGAAAVHFGLPLLLPAAATSLMWHGLAVLVGFAAGAGAAEWESWAAFPKELSEAVRDTASMTFRFWARFGRIFDAVVRGAKVSGALEADLPLSIASYPVLAWPAVLIGYATAPVLSVLGAVYKTVQFPIRAAVSGMRRIVDGLIPWLIDAVDFIVRIIRKLGPAVYAFVSTSFQDLLSGGFVGAMALAGDVYASAARPSTWFSFSRNAHWWLLVPQTAGLFAVRILAYAATAVLAAAGAVVGAVLNLPYAAVDGLLAAVAHDADPADRVFKAHQRWKEGVGFQDLAPLYRSIPDDPQLTVPGLAMRLGTSIGRAILAVPYFGLLYAVNLGLAFGRLFGLTEITLSEMPRPRSKPLFISRPVQAIPTVPDSPWGSLAAGLAGAVLGTFLAPALGLGAAAAVAAGAFTGLALSRSAPWRNLSRDIATEFNVSAAETFTSFARLGLTVSSALTSEPLDQDLYDQPTLELSRYPALAVPAVIIGELATGVTLAGSAVLNLFAAPIESAWLGAVSIVTAGLIRRIVRFIRDIIVNILPFTVGTAWGLLWGPILSGFAGAGLAGAPMDKSLDNVASSSLSGLLVTRV
ncbi:MAG: hypothetical protein WC943_10365, partial [Elusimicrobiota bacterium]